MSKLIVHIAQTEVSENSGMGRVAYHWKKALTNHGFEFYHIGPEQVGRLIHAAAFPYKALKHLQTLGKQPDLVMIHEPAAGPFVGEKFKTIVVSHGIERRHWIQRTQDPRLSEGPVSVKTKMLFPLWRLKHCDAGLRRGNHLFLLNEEDKEFALKYYERKPENVFVFKNGVHGISHRLMERDSDGKIAILFNGSWIPRKGIRTLMETAQLLKNKGQSFHWILAGTGFKEKVVRKDWPDHLQEDLEVIPEFSSADEPQLLAKADLFILPSYFEGQPLALLEAMSAGLCALASDCCGQKDIISHGKNGFLHEPGNAQQLAQQIIVCAADPELRLSVGAAGREMLKHRLWSNVADEVAQQVVRICNK